MAKLVSGSRETVQATVNKAPSSHVLRLLLEPDDLGRPGESRQEVEDLLVWPRLELLDARYRDGSASHLDDPVAPRHCVVGNLPAAQHHAANFFPVDRLVVEH